MRVFATFRDGSEPNKVIEISDNTSTALEELMKIGGRFMFHAVGEKCDHQRAAMSDKCDGALPHIAFHDDYD